MADSLQRVNPLILIADDDETERFLQRQVLEPAGFDIVEAKSGTAALERFAGAKNMLAEAAADAGGGAGITSHGNL